MAKQKTIYEILAGEHREVAALLDQLVSGDPSDEDERAGLFDEVSASLRAHAEAEEAVLYPALADLEGARPLVLEAREEHRIVKRLLAEIDGLTRTGERWDAKVAVLKENVDHHVEEEEGELFERTREGVSDERARELGASYEAKKQALLRGP